MRLFLRKTLIFALIFALVAVGVCVTIDPYNVFHPLSYRENGVEPNKNYIKMVYILHEPDRFDTFLFGSSRIGFLNTARFEGARAYNMSCSMALPREHLDNLKTMLRHGVVLRNVVIEVDDLSYRMDPDNNLNDRQRAPYEYLRSHPLRFAGLYLDPVVAIDSLKIVPYDSPNGDAESFYTSGSTVVYGERGRYHPKEYEDLSGPSYLAGALDALREIVSLCRENEIALTVFVTPMHYATYTGALERGDYEDFLRGLAEVTPYYNFSGYNDITLDPDNYMDTSHYLAEVGDMIIDCIWNGKTDEELLSQGFGFYTDSGNVDRLLGILAQGDLQYAARNDPPVRSVS